MASKATLKRARDEEAEDLTCPITFSVFDDPVMAADGNTYERRAIEEVILSGNHRSPLTNEQLPHVNLVPNRALKKLADAHRARLEAAGARKRQRFEHGEPPVDRISDAMTL